MLHAHYSNRLEALADALVELLAATPADPLRAETVVVPNRGMARWLALHIARRDGVCANVDFPLPADFAWQIFGRVLDDVPAQSPYQPELMAWRLYTLLGGLERREEYRPLHDYLESAEPAAGGPAPGATADLFATAELPATWSDDGERRRYELAQRIARVFDQYLVHRPHWIEAWRGGDDADAAAVAWQPHLWRRLASRAGGHDWVTLRQRLTSATAPALPSPVTLFAIPSLSPGYLEVLAWLARHVDVHLFLLNPCAEYWGDIVTERDARRIAGVEDERALYLETGNSLLASWGRQSRDLLDMLQDLAPLREHERFVEAPQATLLGALQGDLLELRNPGADGQQPTSADAADDSLQIHVCHGPRREVEVLHDQLLARFAADATLTPSDVVVMTPDIDRYAPYIEAVFATAPPQQRIAFGVADRGARSARPLVDGWLGLLELAGGRFEADRLMAVLELPAVARRFGLDEADLEQVHRWIHDVAIRWGADREHRASLGLPPVAEHTWRAGLDRLLLGYAMGESAVGLFAGVLPHDDVEGASAQALGGLVEFFEELRALARQLDRRCAPAAWSDALVRLLGRFFEPGEEEEDDLQRIRDTLLSLADQTTATGVREPVGFALVLGWLRERLERAPTAESFLGHGVTFCAMVPMRSIPFRVVCLLGLDDGIFPRQQRPPSFDLMAQRPRRGDRSLRDDDRMLFLEALLSARDVLYLSYVGRSIRDNATLPPSVLVSELLDYVDRAFDIDEVESVATHLTTVHRLQGFSPQYFDGSSPRLFSYSAELCAASRSRRSGEDAEQGGFLAAPLPEAGAPGAAVDLASLSRFFANPVKFLLRQRLGVLLDDYDTSIEVREPFGLDRLERYRARQVLLELAQAGADRNEALDTLRAMGLVPHGRAGEVLLHRELADVRSFVDSLDRVRAGEELPPLPVEVEAGGIVVSGVLRGLTTAGLHDHRLGKTRPRDRLDLWLRHLLLCAARPAGVATASVWLGDDRALRLRAVSDPRAELASLAALYRAGHSEALHFFPQSSFVYAEAICAGKSTAAATDEALKVWSSQRALQSYPESADPYYERAFRGCPDPLDGRFAELALQVCAPLLAHTEDA